VTDAERDPWIRAVLAEPADVTARLALADYFQDAGFDEKADALRADGYWVVIRTGRERQLCWVARPLAPGRPSLADADFVRVGPLPRYTRLPCRVKVGCDRLPALRDGSLDHTEYGWACAGCVVTIDVARRRAAADPTA
jgi:uncharacterized protein (TIGR02996 family)